MKEILDNRVGWDDSPVECKAEFHRAMRRHPAGRALRGVPAPQRPVLVAPLPAPAVLRARVDIGSIVAMSTMFATAILLFLFYFDLV